MATISLVNSGVDNTDSPFSTGPHVRTFAGQTLNAGEAIVCLFARTTSAGFAWNCTVNGVAASFLKEQSVASPMMRLYIFRCTVPATVVGDIVFTTGATGVAGTVSSVAFALFHATGVTTSGIIVSPNSGTTDPVTAALASVPDGAAVVAITGQNATTATAIAFSGSTKVLDTNTVEGPRRWGAACHVQNGAANPLNVVADYTGTTTTPCIIAVAFPPMGSDRHAWRRLKLPTPPRWLAPSPATSGG